MTKILIINFGSKLNKGSAALLNSMVKTLNKFIPDADFILHSSYMDYNQNNIKEEDSIFKPSKELISKTPLKLTIAPFFMFLQCCLWAVLNKYFKLNIYKLIDERRLQSYYTTDVVVTTGGDSLVDEGFGVSSTIFVFLNLCNISFAILLNKPVVIYAESVGPFNSKLNKFAAKFILNKVKLIMLREEISKGYLEKLGIDKPQIHVTADSAFLLEPVPYQEARQLLLKEGISKSGKPLIMISVNKLISNDRNIKLMAQVVDYLIDTLNATIVFIPHVIEKGSDDRIAADDIYNLVKNRYKIIRIKNEYTPEEFKGMIGQCDLFIGSRMHPTIASTSMYVPTIAITHSHKAYGIIGKMVGQEKYVLHINQLNYVTLISIINDAWYNRTEIKKDLESNIKVVKERALLNGKLVKELLDSLETS